jgi:hypothetical protein
MEPPSQLTAHNDSLRRLTGSPAQVLEEEEPKKPARSAAALGRSGTLSWQQRPKSRTIGGSRRPLSLAAFSADQPAVSPPEPSPEAVAPSRDQIAQSLGAKDPSWFKQTADRGVGSAAYRRNQDENFSETGSASTKRQLPGMSRESSVDPEATSSPPESRPSSYFTPSNATLGSRNSHTSTTSIEDTATARMAISPLPTLESQKFAPPSEQASSMDGGERASMRGLNKSPTHGRSSPDRERSTSPTKGVGGFVQSARLKRSDSVSKRWSTQAPPSPTRQNSYLANRGSAYATFSRLEARPNTLGRENSTEPLSRPTSSSSNLTAVQDAEEITPKPEFVKPALPYHSRSKSVASTFSTASQNPEDPSPPSPSKRWSPTKTKSSWLESALSRPESPKVQQPPPPQPAWMSEINRIKQQRSSVDMGNKSSPQGPFTELPSSGRSAPIKDIQLRPISLRRPESPKKEEPPQPERVAMFVPPSPKFKPAPSPKPLLAAKSVPNLATESSDPKSESKSVEIAPTVSTSKPVSSNFRFPLEVPMSTPATKPKPDTPPKKDFRATLKSRQSYSDVSKGKEVSELESVFGKLKRTQTEKYVAPDTLKDNILRGKGGLTATGGPKPSVRRDEFRDSLISKKTAMLVQAQETGSAAHKRADSSSKPPPTPEALAMRQKLGRTESTSKIPPPVEKEREATPEALARVQTLRAKKSILGERSDQPSASLSSKQPAKANKFADRFNPALAGLLARGPPPMATNPGASSGNTSDSTSTQEQKQGPGPELTHMTKGRARGPKRRTPASKQPTTKDDQGDLKAKQEETVTKEVTSVAATPLVKAKHVLPSSNSQSSKTNNSLEDFPAKQPRARDLLKAKPATPAKSPDLTRKLEKSPTPEVPKKPAPMELDRKWSFEFKSTPKHSPVAIAESRTLLPSPSSLSPKTTLPKTIQSPPIPFTKPVFKALKEIPPQNLDAPPKSDGASPSKPAFSVKNATSSWGLQSKPLSPTAKQVKSPIKLPTKADEEAVMDHAGLSRSSEPPKMSSPQVPKRKPVGLGLGSLTMGSLVSTRSPVSNPPNPPKPYSAKPLPTSASIQTRSQPEPIKASLSLDKSNSAILIEEFFHEKPITTGQLPENINTAYILRNPPFDFGPAGKIRTHRKTLLEITGDGKLIPVPAQMEHILFEDTMYLCTHIYDDSKSARTTEIYLWSGNSVAEPTVEDVQMFARNFAKQNQGQLVHMRQGKESPNFFEALGGIVITRRAHPAPKKYMLCGRRHLGHIVFDEVDFSLKSLCSGYPYIVSTDSGKVYLWKGRGCSQEELSAARLMGMDLTPTGDIAEMNEDSESPEFTDEFPSADGREDVSYHWRHKATADRYRTRLFKIEQHQSSGWGSLQVSSYLPALLRRPSWGMLKDKPAEKSQTSPTTPRSPTITTKVVEIMPFCHRDLEPENIYVLDAYLETYM